MEKRTNMASSSSMALKLACLVLMCMVAGAPLVQAAIGCGQVASNLGACIPYARSGTGAPPAACCSGIRALNSAAKTTPDRQQVCNCLKGLAGRAAGVNYNVVAGIPGKCGVSIPYKISPSTDCKTVK
ncbi:hypothetical protein Tsubulata_002440 [Turnera subulata]|uniref:Non-specific lipid-transfer protein n=1 Tax=Turnera subulata TaxID=218843 RepID=A0A9Q0FAC2_9ROSI|nr:hypothetical protein Tsubulata_002440 [Turnera subulata]